MASLNYLKHSKLMWRWLSVSSPALKFHLLRKHKHIVFHSEQQHFHDMWQFDTFSMLTLKIKSSSVHSVIRSTSFSSRATFAIRFSTHRNNSREFSFLDFHLTVRAKAILTCLRLMTTTCLGRLFNTIFASYIFTKKENVKMYRRKKEKCHAVKIFHQNETRKHMKWITTTSTVEIRHWVFKYHFDEIYIFFLTYPTVNGSNFLLEGEIMKRIIPRVSNGKSHFHQIFKSRE